MNYMSYFLVSLCIISLLFLFGCSAVNVAQNFTKYGEINDYDLQEKYTFFDVSTKVVNSTYLQPEQQTTVGLLHSIELFSKQYGATIEESEYDGVSTYLLKIKQNASIQNKDEIVTHYFWVDADSMLPIHSELYLTGENTLFEKLKSNPAILDLTYGASAAQNMAFPTTKDGTRLWSIDYTFSNINTRLEMSQNCDSYDETTGICIIGVTSTEGDNLGTLEQIQEYDSDILLPTQIPSFALFDYVMNPPPAIVEEPHLFAENIKVTEYYYYNNFSPSIGQSQECGLIQVYSPCKSEVNLQIKLKILQSEDKYLLMSNIPTNATEGKIITINDNKAFFTKSPNSTTLRWSDEQNYFILIFNNSDIISNTIYFDEIQMTQIAESMIKASDINNSI